MVCSGSGKVLGLDWGRVRWGWALSDPERTLASRSGVYTCQNPEEDLAFLERLIHEEGVAEIVLGVPYRMDGSLGPQARQALAFKETLEARFRLPVHLVDERLTSAEAERALLEGDVSRRRRKQRRDALAAVLILQSYLGRSKSKAQAQADAPPGRDNDE